jgi:DNA-binding NarL/FixJ family response regulator
MPSNPRDELRAPEDWWGEVLRTLAEGGPPVTVEDASGARFVLVSEARYQALEASEGNTARPDRARSPLTARELGILQMVADGSPGAVIAESLGLAPNTVAQHLASVRRKFGVRSSAAAAAVARQDGLIV